MNNSPGRGEGRRPRPHDKAQAAAPIQTRASQYQCKPNRTTSPARIVHRAQHVVDTAALLALDLASIASESGRAQHARAALHLRDATAAAWLAAEALLAEGVL